MFKLTLLVALCAAVALVVAALSKAKRTSVCWPFYAKRVLSQPEQVLYWRLVEALPGHVVLAQVQLSRFLGIKKGHRPIEWLNRISQKSADFVVCSKDFAVLVVIELDDASHRRGARKKADEDKNKAVGDAGLSLIRWQVKQLPSLEEIRLAVLPTPPESAGEVTRGVGSEPPTGNASNVLGTLPRRWQ